MDTQAQAQAQGAYQHDYIQASLLREWKLKTKQRFDDGFYNIHLNSKSPRFSTTPAPRTEASMAARRTRASAAAPRTEASAAAPTAAVPPRTTTTETPAAPTMPVPGGGSRIAAWQRGIAAWLREVMRRPPVSLYPCLVVVSTAVIFRVFGYDRVNLDLDTPFSIPKVLNIPATVRRADEEAFDRIAMKLSDNWQRWTVSPPFLSVPSPWPQYPSRQMQQLHENLIRIVNDNFAHNIGGDALMERLRWANGFDDQEEVYIPWIPHGWLRDASQCWQSVPPVLNRIYCPVACPNIATQAEEQILHPWAEYVAEQLDFLQNALILFTQLQDVSTQQQADTLVSVHDMFAKNAQATFPLPIIGAKEKFPHHQPSQKQYQLTALYEHYARAAFFELLATTVQPELRIRIERLESFQRSIGSQRDLFQKAASTAIPTFHKETLDWISGLAAYTLRSETFANATTMKKTACDWTLRRMPLSSDLDPEQQDQQQQPQPSSSNPPPTRPSASSPTKTPSIFTLINTSRISLYNTLVTHLWLSSSSPPSTRWQWDEGGAFTHGKDEKVSEEWAKYVQRKLEQVWVGCIQQQYQQGGDGDGAKVEEEVKRLLPLPPNKHALLWNWPRLRDRKECRDRHVGLKKE
ncbi:hypothetical protein BST61_g11455 [Cercospora zeina]